MIIRQSWNVLKQDKGLAWIPVFSGIANLIIFAFFTTLFFIITRGGGHFSEAMDHRNLGNIGSILVFLYYISVFFVTNYFLAGLYSIVHGRFAGKNLSLSNGLTEANRHIHKIFIWSVISTTVGLLLKLISDNSKLVGKIVAAIFGAAWNILTYFSLPSLIIGEKSVTDSFKESAAMIRKTWGETIIVNFGVSLVFGAVFFLVTALTVGLIILIPLPEVVIVISILYILFLITLIVLSSTLGAIFKLALYEYASTGVVPQGFTPEIIQGAIVTRT